MQTVLAVIQAPNGLDQLRDAINSDKFTYVTRVCFRFLMRSVGRRSASRVEDAQHSINYLTTYVTTVC